MLDILCRSLAKDLVKIDAIFLMIQTKGIPFKRHGYSMFDRDCINVGSGLSVLLLVVGTFTMDGFKISLEYNP